MESEPCLVCVFHAKSKLSFHFMMHFFSFVRITSYSILFVFPNLYVHIYLPVTVDRYLDRYQAFKLWATMHHYWVSALKHIQIYIIKKKKKLYLFLWSLRSPDHVFMATNYTVSLIIYMCVCMYMYVCVCIYIYIYICIATHDHTYIWCFHICAVCLSFVSSRLIPNFKVFFFLTKTIHT